MSDEELILECRKYIIFDKARISNPIRYFLVIGFKANSFVNINGIDTYLEYYNEKTIASGDTKEELLEDAKWYGKIS